MNQKDMQEKLDLVVSIQNENLAKVTEIVDTLNMQSRRNRELFIAMQDIQEIALAKMKYFTVAELNAAMDKIAAIAQKAIIGKNNS